MDFLVLLIALCINFKKLLFYYRYSSFIINANNLRDNYRFGKVINKPEVNAHFKVSEDTIVAFKQYDDFFKLYEGDSKTKNLETFIVDNSFTVVE